MEVIMKVKDIMSRDLACINSEDSVATAAKLMKDYDVGSIPVCADKKLVGIITDRDIALRSIAEGENQDQKNISDIMTSNLVVGNPEMNVDDAAKLMSSKKIRRLPIVENNNLVGIVALGDISLEPALQDNAEDTLKNISEPGA
jgi:CBS domain-containing protein